MAKFVFRMNSLLDLRYKLEDQEKIQYGIARQKLTEEEEKLEALKKQMMQYELRYRLLTQSKLYVIEIKQTLTAIENMKTLINKQRLVIAQANKNLEAARIKLNKAIQERKTIEKLKENAFEQFKRDLESAEQKEVDELVSFMYNSAAGYEED